MERLLEQRAEREQIQFANYITHRVEQIIIHSDFSFTEQNVTERQRAEWLDDFNDLSEEEKAVFDTVREDVTVIYPKGKLQETVGKEVSAYYTENGNLVVCIRSSGRRVLYKGKTLVQNQIPLELAKMEASGYTVGGHSALEWLLAQVQPDQVLRKGWVR